jgi:CheY-like chemotaxis protein
MTVEPVEVLLLAFGAFETTDTQTLTALQAAVARGRMPPVVLVSADGAKPLELPAGFEASIVGGAVSTSVLFNAVQEAVAARARGPSARPASNDQVDHGARALYGKQLLVVDDSEVNLKLAQRILALEGAQVTVAANGQEAVDLLRLAPNAFDAVLMDLQMPMLDGFEATRQIRNVLGLTSLPIVALTAGTLMSERRRATDAGMDDFISKPFVIRAVIDKLVRLLSPAQAEQPQPARVSRSPAVPPSWPVIDGMDAGKSFAAMVGDEALLTDMLARLMAEFADLELPPLAANGGTLTARLHKLSGTAGTMGATMLGNAAKAWELALGRTGGAGAEELGATVARELRRLRVSAQPLLVAGQEPVRAVDVAPDVIARAEPATNLDLDELIGLLKQQSFRALDVFAALTPALRPEIGEHDFAALSTALNALQYERAVSILECTRKCPSAAR